MVYSNRKLRKPRKYDASRRQQRAAENRDRVLDAARQLFSTRGYVETTLDAIATEAGVALPTLYAMFRSKSGVLAGLVSRLVAGEPDRAILQSAGAKEVLAETDPRKALQLFAGHMNQILERLGPVYEAMKSAARTEPDAAEMFARAQASRAANLQAVADHLARLRALRPGLSVEDAGRTIWALASAEVRQLLLVQAQWTADRYQSWLAGTLVAALLK